MTSACSPLSATQRAAEDDGRQGRRVVTLGKNAPTLNAGASFLKFPSAETRDVRRLTCLKA